MCREALKANSLITDLLEMPDHRQHVVRRILAFPICSTAAICIHEPETVPHDPIFSGIRTGRFGVWLGSVVFTQSQALPCMS